jgi:hypothetical protein
MKSEVGDTSQASVEDSCLAAAVGLIQQSRKLRRGEKLFQRSLQEGKLNPTSEASHVNNKGKSTTS